MKNRMKEIKAKGFAMYNVRDNDRSIETIDFAKIKVGAKILTDPILEDLSSYKKLNPKLGDKVGVMKALETGDYVTLREISDFFYKTSGIYSRLCRYMAYLYRFDWMITPFISGNVKKSNEELRADFYRVLQYFDAFEIKRFGGEVFLKVIKDGCYYGYIVENGNKIAIQDLPASYCRSRYSVNGRPVVEFNMKYFDDAFRDVAEKMRALTIFPKDFAKGYKLYKEGKLPAESITDRGGWYTLDTDYAIKFNLNGQDFPAFASVIPAIIDLDAAQELDRKRMAQKLMKIIIQKMPIDKNGDLVFDVDEAQQLHNNAVHMLQKAIGIDVLTTFADVDVASMSDNTTTATVDELEKIERGVYNEAGVSQMQFNTSGNLALEKSILNDEASMYNLLLQIQDFLNFLLDRKYNKSKNIHYQAQILTTTIYNYKEMAKLYKEQTQLGYSKMLPQIALGQTQSSILANAYFENDILDLANVFIPPMMSSTMNSDVLKRLNDSNKEGKSITDKITGDENEGGRPTNESKGEETSPKTIQNKESQK